MSRKKSRRAKFEGSLERHGRMLRARWVANGRIYTMSTGYGLGERSKAEAKLKEIMEPFKIQHEIERLKALQNKIETREKKIEAYIDSLPAMSLMNAFAAYRKTKKGRKAKEETAKMYESQFNRLIDWMKVHHADVKELRQITGPMAEEFFDYLDKSLNLTENTHNKYLALFSSIWKTFMAIEGKKKKYQSKSPLSIATSEEAASLAKLTDNPWESVDRYSIVNMGTSRRVLTVEELQKVFDKASGEFRILFALGFYTGYRLGDCAQLKWEEVDLVRGLIIRDPGKTKNSSGITVVMPLHAALSKILYQIPPEARRGFILPNCAHDYVHNRGEFSKAVNEVFSECGIERQIRGEGRAKVIVGFHSLRHSFVSLCCERNMGSCNDSLEMVRQLVGHTNVKMTQLYNTSSTNALRSVVDVLPNVTEERQEEERREIGTTKQIAKEECAV